MSTYLGTLGPLPAGDFEQITVSTTALGGTSTKLAINLEGGKVRRAVKIRVSVETNSIRYRIDGTDPTASIGHLVVAGEYFDLEGETNISRLRMIRASADATVNITYFYVI